ncbi:TniB family NTP-binding protein [Halopseudomonas laoshanensis]|uniref:TniB family NTP-binding protein n=1 Tax=Halopseudomonas laoshanensis TaxID=2268758 RepID=UPI0037370BD4
MTGLRKQTVYHDRFQTALDDLHEAFRRSVLGESVMTALIGPSRTGKSAVIEALIREIAGCALKRPVLNVLTPKQPTPRALVDACLGSIGMSPAMFRNQIDAHKAFLGGMSRLETKLIIFDETQHMLERSGDRAIRGAGDFFKGLFDQSQSSIVLAGLPSLEGLFANEQLAGRSRPSTELFPYCWHGESYKSFRKALASALECLHEASWETFQLNDGEFAKRMYIASAGRYGLVHKIFSEVLITCSQFKRAGYDEFNTAYQACVRPEGIDFNPFDVSKIVEQEHMALAYTHVMTAAGISSRRSLC